MCTSVRSENTDAVRVKRFSEVCERVEFDEGCGREGAVSQEITRATTQYKALSYPLPEIDTSNFPLPTLGPKLRNLNQTKILAGIGFVLITGLPVSEWTKEEQVIACLGICSYFGDLVPQSRFGDLLGHVFDYGRLKAGTGNDIGRIYASNKRQHFHTDGSDIVGLLCLSQAEEGGRSMLASTATVYNDLMKRRPDVIDTMLQPFHWDRKNEQSEGSKPYHEAPILHYHANKPFIHLDQNFFYSATRHPNVPPPTTAQIEAINEIENSCNQFKLTMELKPGDLQIVHNHSVLHDREAFVDSGERSRYLFRVWISTGGLKGAWELPWEVGENGEKVGGRRRRGGMSAWVSPSRYRVVVDPAEEEA
ncbi:hypothetical protein HDU76_012275 [Blyttiomyces sp. JEL0837]|nr:hypothetical protein HDU76_012275 [Blyttiomyces sp. JEL0837]